MTCVSVNKWMTAHNWHRLMAESSILVVILPQPCDPPRSGYLKWNKPLRHPFCSTETSWQIMEQSQNTWKTKTNFSNAKQQGAKSQTLAQKNQPIKNSAEMAADQLQDTTAWRVKLWFNIASGTYRETRKDRAEMLCTVYVLWMWNCFCIWLT